MTEYLGAARTTRLSLIAEACVTISLSYREAGRADG